LILGDCFALVGWKKQKRYPAAVDVTVSRQHFDNGAKHAISKPLDNYGESQMVWRERIQRAEQRVQGDKSRLCVRVLLLQGRVHAFLREML
jgi:hypothetical protein